MGDEFYTCSIFLLDRFYFIPYRFEDPFTMFRHVNTQEVLRFGTQAKNFARWTTERNQ